MSERRIRLNQRQEDAAATLAATIVVSNHWDEYQRELAKARASTRAVIRIGMEKKK